MAFPLQRLRHFFRRRRFEADMAEEMTAHLEMQSAANRSAGMDAEEARRAAIRQFGGIDQVKEVARAQRAGVWLEQLLQDVRYGMRALLKSPAHTAVCILVLALGIGACTALFSVVYGVLLDPFPYRQPDAIWVPFFADPRSTWRHAGQSFAEYQEIRRLPAVADAMAAAYEEDDVVETASSPPEDQDGVLMSPDAFRFLGVVPLLGRTISAADYRPDGDGLPVVVLSHALWQRVYGGDRNILGKTLTVNGTPRTVIGVMPSRFGWYTNNGFWLPMPGGPSTREVNVYVRFGPGTTTAIAGQQLEALQRRWARERPPGFYPDDFTGGFVNLLDITAASGRLRTNLRLLGFAVGFLLLIACTNVANLQLARASVRGREIAIRLAVGATRRRIVRQLMTESLWLSVGGGILGVLTALGLTRLIVTLIPADFLPNEARVAVNGTVLLAAAGISLLTGWFAGLAPALHGSRPELGRALKDGGWAAGAGRQGSRTRNALVVVQITLSVVLLSGAALIARGFVDLEHLPLGFADDHLLRVRLPKNAPRYGTYERSIAFDREVLARVRNLPGVEAAALGNVGFPLPGARSRVSLEGQPGAGGHPILCGFVSDAFLRTLQIPLLQGRDFTARDMAATAPLCLINEAAARLLPAGEDPVGQRLRVDWLAEPSGPGNLAPAGEPAEVTVIGIVGDTRTPGALGAPPPAIFLPYTLRALRWRMLALRTATEPSALLNAVRAQIRSLDPEEPVDEPTTVREMIAAHMAPPRFSLWLFGGLAGLGLALAVAGIYGVLAFQVARREREFGIRVALGADPPTIAALILGTTAQLVGAGLAGGLMGILALSRFVTSEVFIRSSLDPASVVLAGIAISVAALFACALPARRAAKVDPIVALRAE